MGNFERVIQVLEAAAQRSPLSAEVPFELGNLRFQSQDCSLAVTAYATATHLKPDYGLAHHNLALAQMKLRNDAQAIKSFRDALRCQPELVSAHINLGDLLTRTGRSADLIEARQHLELARKLDPLNRRSAELLEQGEAKKWWDRATNRESAVQSGE